jgi:hypothetical protein
MQSRNSLRRSEMSSCFLCNEEKDTRKLYTGSARGFSDLCFDCTITFFKLKSEE